ncbi:MAG: hypothetical protein JST85_10430 [Acidobacteria bacterium]|nr:hypothetical protein [Acidobacteriota bacterium]
MPHFFDSPTRRANLWLVVFAILGSVLVWLYPDAEQQDAAYHFLFARWAWEHPTYLISVWARPLFTLAYFIPAQLGYPAAKLFTVAISLVTAWQTFQLARQVGLHRAELAVPLLFLQPAFFALASVTMTETLFALVFVIALRLHVSQWFKAGMFVASLLILIRPEGFFLGTLWGVWMLWELVQSPKGIRDSQTAIRILQCLLLASGMFAWWGAAYWMTGDVLWIAHNWPPDWQVDGQANGTGPIWWYAVQLPLIVGIPLFVPFLIGLWGLLKRRELSFATSSFLALFVLHSLMFMRGWFGSAGYARYFVCVSPVVALISLAGWNVLAEERNRFFNLAKLWVAYAVLIIAGVSCLLYVDSIRFARDAWAVDTMHTWIRSHRPELFASSSATYFTRLISSQAYPFILLGRDSAEKPAFAPSRERNLELIRQTPPGTLVLWEEETGPKWYQLQAEDFEQAGYRRLKSQDFRLQGFLLRLPWDRLGGWRFQRMHWFYKEPVTQP